MHRRNFLYSSAAFAAPFAASRKPASTEPIDDVKLGPAACSFREFHLPQIGSSTSLAQGRAQFDKAGIKVIGGGNASHCAAAPSGSSLSFRAELMGTEKSRANFKAQVRTGEAIVGEAMRRRAVIDVTFLCERVEDARR